MSALTQEEGSKPNYPPPGDLLTARQVEKLDLQIESLREQNKWEPSARFIPMITAAIGVLGLIVSVIVFGIQQASDQEKTRTSRELERRTALQNQIRGDTDELLRFTGDPKLSVSRAVFLLSDIKTVLDLPANRTVMDPPGEERQKLVDVLPGYKKGLTLSLAILVKDDCDFSKYPRDVELAKAVVTNWDDYSDYLRTESKTLAKLDYILYKYTEALKSLDDRNPGYLKSLYLDKDGLEPGPKYAKQKDEHVTYNHFLNIVDGFKKHLEILSKDNTDQAKTLKKTQLEEFEGNMCNPAVSRYELGNDFIGAPCKLRR